jgi:hypothetical protein
VLQRLQAFQRIVRAAAGVAAIVLLASPVAARDAASGDTELAQFQERVEQYAALRGRVETRVPRLAKTDSPEKITEREHALGAAIRAERSGARAGDVFGAAADRIRAIVRDDWAQRSSAERAGLLDELPPVGEPAVNADYPPTLPLATFPATLLARLPTLPDDVEYRLYGPHLILRDAKANVVIDVLPRALERSAAAAKAR